VNISHKHAVNSRYFLYIHYHYIILSFITRPLIPVSVHTLPYEGVLLPSSSGVPKPISGCPLVWIASINMASSLQNRTSQLWFVNPGPAGSRPVKFLVHVIGIRMRGYINERKLQQCKAYNNNNNNTFYYLGLHFVVGVVSVYGLDCMEIESL